jgi:NADH dehydrogenase FAD-containing subunit
MRVLVQGAGFGGLELTTRLSAELGDDVEVTLIDKGDGFVFGRTTAEAVMHSYDNLVKPGVRFVRTTIRAIDPTARTVETDAGTFEGTSSSWRSAPTSTRRRRPAWARRGTRSTRCPGRSPPAR